MRRWPKVYREDSFVDSDGSYLLKGTPVYWYRCSYEYEEWDETLAVVELRLRVMEESTDWGRLAHEMEIRERHRAA